MIAASLIASIEAGQTGEVDGDEGENAEVEESSEMRVEEAQYLNGKGSNWFLKGYIGSRHSSLPGEYKAILQLVTVLSHGKREWTSAFVTSVLGP